MPEGSTEAWECTWLTLKWKASFFSGSGWDEKDAALIAEHGRMGYELVSAAPIIDPKNARFILFFKRKLTS